MGIFSKANDCESEKTFGKKKCFIKKKPRKTKPIDASVDLLDRSITLRFPAKEVKKRVLWLIDNIGYCQICGTFYNPDYPHHALDGTGRKDDRTMICICTDCHSTIHTKGFDTLPKTEEEIVGVSWDNNMRYLCDIKQKQGQIR